MSMPGMGEWLLIFLVVLLVFGAKRIPEIARGMGQGIREFKDATSDLTKEITQVQDTAKSINKPQAPRQGTPTPRTQAAEQEPVHVEASDDEAKVEKQAS